MPSQAKTMFGDFRRLLSSGPFPQVFSGIGAAHLFAVAAPDPAVLNSPGYLAARSRVVKVQGTAPSCDRSIEGSGFVYAPQHVLTNAHVVAGVKDGPTVTTVDGTDVPARRVVLYDPQVDIAVLYVPGLNLTPLQFDDQAQAGAEAVVAGYPLDHSFTAVPARIGGTQNAVGPDIYQTGTVDRQIFEIRALVQPGNSGGPLLSPSGTVYGVVFAAAVNTSDTGFALTASEVSADAQRGRRPDHPDVHPGLRLGGLGSRRESLRSDSATAARPSRSIRAAMSSALRGHVGGVDARVVGRVLAHVPGAAAQQGDRAAGVAAAGVGQADRDLREAPPELAVRGRGRLPGGLEDLVGVERVALGQQPAAELGRLGRGDHQVVGDARHVLGARRRPGERAAELVARPRVPRPAARVPVPRGSAGLARRAARHRSGSGSASQPRSSESNSSGRSSCG